MNPTAARRPVPSVVAALRHRWTVVLLVFLIALGLAAAFAILSGRSYQASATLLLRPVPASPLSDDASASSDERLVAMRTEAQLAGTVAVLEAVGDELGEEFPADGEDVLIEAPDGTQVLDITVRSPSRARAREGAQQVAESYLAYREQLAKEDKEGQLEALQAEAESSERSLRRTLGQGGGSALTTEQAQLDAAELAELRQALLDTRLIGTDPGRIISPAERPLWAGAVPPWAVLAVGVIGGSILGLLLAWWLEWRGARIRSGTTPILDRPRLADLPASVWRAKRAGRMDREMATVLRPVRSALIGHHAVPGSIAVCGATRTAPGGLCLGLAGLLGEAGYRTLVVASDPDSDDIAGALGVSQGPGLLDVVRGQRSVEEVVVRTNAFAVLPRGKDTQHATALDHVALVRATLRAVSEPYDVTIVQTPPGDEFAGDAILSACDASLVVVERDVSTADDVRDTLDHLQVADVDVVGVITVPPPPTRAPVGTPEPVAATTGPPVVANGPRTPHADAPRR